jgi:hypothetical protein
MTEHGPLLEKLLAGEFICAVSDADNYRRLQDERVREGVDAYLKPLNRRLAQTQDGQLFVVGYLHHDETAREQLKAQFTQVIQALLPLLEWMQLVQEAMGRDGALGAGDTIKLQEFVLKTEDNQSLRQRLKGLASDKFFNSHADAVDAQVKQIFKRLRDHGYLRQPHPQRQFYEVTGKIDYLIELVRFIRDEENLPVEDDVRQEELL